MIGRFLEISLHAPDILASLDFWERLGFEQIPTNDVWTHPYAVLSDGRAIIGLHKYEFDSPALTFVRQDLARHLDGFRQLGIEFEFAKVEYDQFHEAGFLSPDGQMITLLETRTCSPPGFEGHGFSLCGDFEALMLPVRRMDEALPFWARIGMAVVAFDEENPETALLRSGTLSLLLNEDRKLKQPALVFHSADIDSAAEEIARKVTEPERDRGGALRLQSPEGLDIVINRKR